MSGQVQTEQIDWIDSAKGLAILGVVGYHAMLLISRAGAPFAGQDAVVSLVQYGLMPLFFFVSGMVNGPSIAWSRAKVWRRLLSMSILFVLWQPIVFLHRIVSDLALQSSSDSSLSMEFARALLSPIRPNGELWFLWALILYHAVALLCANVDRRLQLLAAGILAVVWPALVSNLDVNILHVMGNGWIFAPSLYVTFLIGIIGRPLVTQLSRHVTLGRLFVAMAMAALAMVIIVTIGVYSLPGLPLVLSVAAIGFFSSVGKLLDRVQLFSWAGRNSLALYLVHMPVLVIAASVTAIFVGIASKQEAAALFTMAAVLAITVIILFPFIGDKRRRIGRAN